MLSITKKTALNSFLLAFIFLVFNSCEEKGNIRAKVYTKGKLSNEFYGVFYTTDYGGLNYHVPNKEQQTMLFNAGNIDSIIFTIDRIEYISKPLARKSFSREQNKSDFSFFINSKTHKIVVDTIGDLQTMLLFSEKTDIEKLKDNGIIKATLIKK
jgi:hypothetical protein